MVYFVLCFKHNPYIFVFSDKHKSGHIGLNVKETPLNGLQNRTWGSLAGSDGAEKKHVQRLRGRGAAVAQSHIIPPLTWSSAGGGDPALVLLLLSWTWQDAYITAPGP